MSLTDEERCKQIAEWDAEIDEAKRDQARYEKCRDEERAAEAAKRIDTFTKLKAELVQVT
jgi:hypothetical protein